MALHCMAQWPQPRARRVPRSRAWTLSTAASLTMRKRNPDAGNHLA
jgi:hypothetical protein